MFTNRNERGSEVILNALNASEIEILIEIQNKHKYDLNSNNNCIIFIVSFSEFFDFPKKKNYIIMDNKSDEQKVAKLKLN